MKKIKYSLAVEIDNEVGRMYRKDPDLRDQKFGYYFKRFSDKNLVKAFRKYAELLEDIHYENALTDEKTKKIVTNNESSRGYDYSKEGLTACIKEERKLFDDWQEKEIEIEEYYCPPQNLPELTDYQKELFAGIFFKVEKENE